MTITYQLWDSAGSVTRDVVLPDCGANGTSIEWATSDSNRITTGGAVSRSSAGSGDVSVTVTATISKGAASAVRDFILVVRELMGTVSDTDGNVYQTVRIGNQVWTVENLRTTRYNDGSPITLATAVSSWANGATEKYCYYNNTTNADSIAKFGALYNLYAVKANKLAPAGWHVATDAEWDTLQNYLIANGYNWDDSITGNKITKSLASNTDWSTDTTTNGSIGKNPSMNNQSGFSALPGGYRDSYGSFFGSGTLAYWWGSPVSGSLTPYARNLVWSSSAFFKSGHVETCGFSVRLVKD